MRAFLGPDSEDGFHVSDSRPSFSPCLCSPPSDMSCGKNNLKYPVVTTKKLLGNIFFPTASDEGFGAGLTVTIPSCIFSPLSPRFTPSIAVGVCQLYMSLVTVLCTQRMPSRIAMTKVLEGGRSPPAMDPHYVH